MEEKQLNKNDSELSCLQNLKDYVKENRELDNFSRIIDDKFLLHFVRGCKYDSKKALQIFKNYFCTRRSKVEFFKTLNPTNNLGLDAGIFRVLKYTDHLNRLVLLDRNRLWNPNVVSIEDIFKMFVLWAEELWDSEEAEKNGIVVIFDLSDWTLLHTRYITPTVFLKGINLLWNNFPLRYKGFHIVNENILFTMMFKAVKLFIPKKLRDRIHFHSNNLESLHENLPRDILPESLGGKLIDEEAFDDKFEFRIRDKESYYETFADCLTSDTK